MRIRAVCISEKKGTQKINVHSGRLIENFGLENDAHAGDWHRQISLLAYEDIQDFRKRGAQVGDGDFGENLIIEGMGKLEVGALLKCGGAILQVTQLGKECRSHCQIYHKMGECIMPIRGVFARVLKGGIISEGDTVIYDNA